MSRNRRHGDPCRQNFTALRSARDVGCSFGYVNGATRDAAFAHAARASNVAIRCGGLAQPIVRVLALDGCTRPGRLGTGNGWQVFRRESDASVGDTSADRGHELDPAGVQLRPKGPRS